MTQETKQVENNSTKKGSKLKKYGKIIGINILALGLSFGVLQYLENIEVISVLNGFIAFPIVFVFLYFLGKKIFKIEKNYIWIIFLLFIVSFSTYGYISGKGIICPIGKHATRDCGYLPGPNGIIRSSCGDWKCVGDDYKVQILKPVIYLYPKQKEKVKVELDYKGKLIATYPDYNKKIKGWKVEAYPDGKVVDLRDQKEYSYLFWEGITDKKIDYDLSKGFIVKGENVKEFLQEKLLKMGLTPKEYNEFIVYWYPKMMNNKYNLVHFAGKNYTDTAPLKITPKPDSILRVFMVFKALEKPIRIEKQKIKTWKRTGFSVVEWGGSELK